MILGIGGNEHYYFRSKFLGYQSSWNDYFKQSADILKRVNFYFLQQQYADSLFLELICVSLQYKHYCNFDSLADRQRLFWNSQVRDLSDY